MEFILITPDKLKVLLDPEDLAALGITYEELDYADPLTKQALLSLLERGKGEAGFHPKRSKLFIEVFPSEDGGCALYFTCLRAGQQPGLSGPGPVPVVFRFEDTDSLLDAAAKVFGRFRHRIYKSSLYRMGGSYRLVVYPLDYTDHLSVTLLGEFSQRSGEGETLAAFLEEHGEPLLEDDALDTLARHFGPSAPEP